MIKGRSIIKISRATAMLLTLLHLFIGISYTFYIHVHTLENGKRVVHSHPITSGDSRSEAHHQHDLSVLQLIPDLRNSISQVWEPITFSLFLLSTVSFFFAIERPEVNIHSLPQRAPPIIG